MNEALAQLPANLSNHLRLSVLALGLALAIGLPLALLAARRPRLRAALLAVVGVVQTVPGLALLALMVPVVAGLSGALEAATGRTLSALGFLPALMALSLYGLLPIVRNAIVGINGVDPATVEVARGLGMSPRQVLRRVELPLAAPVIVAGVRTAAVWVVGTATLATPVGQRSLGNFIFAGLQTRNWTLVAVGCVASAVLALSIDGLLGLIERAAAERKRGLGLAAGLALAALFLGGIAAPSLLRNSSERPIRVGAKTFTEQYILAELLAERLESAGFRAERVTGLGSNFALDALSSGDVDILVDYTGTIWSSSMKRTGTASRDEVMKQVISWLKNEARVTLLGPLGFENAYALAMRREVADRLNIRTIEDLARHADSLSFGTDYEFLDRPEWASLVSTYGLAFATMDSYDPSFLYDAARRGEVDVISAYTTDGRIDAFDLVLLEDPRQAIPPYDAVLMLSEAAASDRRLVDALRPLIGAIGPDAMRRANGAVDSGRSTSPAAAARSLAADLVRDAAISTSVPAVE